MKKLTTKVQVLYALGVSYAIVDQIFAGGENFHGKYEFVALESMEKATDVIVEIAKLNAER